MSCTSVLGYDLYVCMCVYVCVYVCVLPMSCMCVLGYELYVTSRENKTHLLQRRLLQAQRELGKPNSKPKPKPNSRWARSNRRSSIVTGTPGHTHTRTHTHTHTRFLLHTYYKRKTK